MRKYIDEIKLLNESLQDEHAWLIEAFEEQELEEGKWSKFVAAGGVAAGLAMGAMGDKAKAATPLPQEVAACSSQKLSWCDTTQNGALAQDQDDVMKMAATKALKQFRYDATDQSSQKTDTWKSFHNEVGQELRWKGDCDDLTLTTIELAVQSGVSETRLYRALVAVEQGEPGRKSQVVMGHMVGVYEDTNGEFWVIGDSNNPRTPMQPLRNYKNSGAEIRYVSPVAMGAGWQKAENLGKLERVKQLRAAEQKPMQVAQTSPTVH